jgi:hypothetical protein
MFPSPGTDTDGTNYADGRRRVNVSATIPIPNGSRTAAVLNRYGCPILHQIKDAARHVTTSSPNANVNQSICRADFRVRCFLGFCRQNLTSEDRPNVRKLDGCAKAWTTDLPQ